MHTLKKLSAVALLGGLLATACAPTEPLPAPVPPSTTASPEDTAQAETPPAPPRESPLETLARTHSARFDLARFAHFAVPSHHESLRIELGRPGALKHLGGGWRTGWDPTPRTQGQERYLEANNKVARVTFRHRAGGFDKVVVRMKAVRRSNKVTLKLNNRELGKVELGADWADYTLAVPAEATRDGENHLTMAFSGSIREEGRPQFAHVSEVKVVAPGGDPSALPGTPLTGAVTLGGQERAALIASGPLRWSWLLEVPHQSPRLGLAFGAPRPGARLKVTLHRDGATQPQLLFEGTAQEADRWQEANIELADELAGQVVELVVDIDGDNATGAALAGALHGPSPRARQSPTQARNILVYLIDTLRHDKLGAYNPDSSVPTPNFDAFAKDAAVFEAAYDTENWTMPSTASILTGLQPWNHTAKDGESKLPASVLTISEHLQGEGFRTGSFIANGYVSNKFGFDQGWHFYTNYIREHKVTDAGGLVNDALGWIDRQKGQRWFAYVHTIDPHVPYSAPGPFKFARWEAKRRGKYTGPLRAQNTGNQIADIKTGKLKPDENDRIFFESLYDGEVAYNDQEFGRLLDGLRQRGVYDDTLIIVVADHGEEFWDHGSVGHGHSLYDEMVHTPLFMRHPGWITPGGRLPQVVSTTGIVPTTLEVLGVKPMEGIDGASLVDLFDGVGDPHPRAAVTDFMYRQKAIRAGRMHWQTDGLGQGKLFDVIDDRKQTRDLSKTHPLALAFVRQRFGMFMGAPDHARWWEGEGGVARPGQRIEQEAAEIDDELRQQLEAMGYIDGATSEHSPSKDKALKDQEEAQEQPAQNAP